MHFTIWIFIYSYFSFISGFVMKEPVQTKPTSCMPGQEMLPLPDSPKVHLGPLGQFYNKLLDFWFQSTFYYMSFPTVVDNVPFCSSTLRKYRYGLLCIEKISFRELLFLPVICPHDSLDRKQPSSPQDTFGLGHIGSGQQERFRGQDRQEWNKLLLQQTDFFL